jgi:hypothetical protein
MQYYYSRLEKKLFVSFSNFVQPGVVIKFKAFLNLRRKFLNSIQHQVSKDNVNVLVSSNASLLCFSIELSENNVPIGTEFINDSWTILNWLDD